jgi:hypothetical protein
MTVIKIATSDLDQLSTKSFIEKFIASMGISCEEDLPDTLASSKALTSILAKVMTDVDSSDDEFFDDDKSVV